MKAGISVSTLDDWMDIALNGKPGEAWGSAYYKGVVKKAASTVRIIPRRYTTLTGVEVDEKDIKSQFGLDINVDNLLYQSSIALNRFGKRGAFETGINDDIAAKLFESRGAGSGKRIGD